MTKPISHNEALEIISSSNINNTDKNRISKLLEASESLMLNKIPLSHRIRYKLASGIDKIALAISPEPKNILE